MSAGSDTRKEIRSTAQRCESLGYCSLLYNDHYLGPGAAMTAGNHPPQPIAAIPTVVTAAEATTTLRVGFRVICVDYHHPVVLIKELASLDVLTEGRLEVGLGAGWLASEYEAMGIPFESAPRRLARLRDFVALLTESYLPSHLDFRSDTGIHATGFESMPKPIQQPRPPIAIGGGGKQVLKLAAEVADVVAFNMDNRAQKLSSDGAARTTAEATDEKIDWIREVAGKRLPSLRLEIGAYFTAVTDDVRGAAERLSARLGGRFDMNDEDILAHPHVLVGSVDAICDTLLERRERYGFSDILVHEAALEALSPIVDRMAGK
jgi:probable F420-dependent oxidoreductase